VTNEKKGPSVQQRRQTAPDRLRRLLAIIPWITANPGRPVAEVAERFGLTEAQLLADLDVVIMVGLPPYSPDALIEVAIEDRCVTIRLADYFSRPLRLTPAEGLALLASSDALLSIPGTPPDGALARALQKLAGVMGPRADTSLDVHLGNAEAGLLQQIRDAIAARRQVGILYYSHGRDERASRQVHPWRVFSDLGAWYLHAWCEQAQDERIFRVDRIEELTPSTDPITRVLPETTATSVFQPNASDPVVRLKLTPEATWVIEAYPVEVVEKYDDGSALVDLVITGPAWFERLMLGLGPTTEIVDDQPPPSVQAGDNQLGASQLRTRAVQRTLARYRRRVE